MAERVTIVGGSVAALVAARAAAMRGRLVTLLVDPARVGGSFQGVAAAGRRFDLGCRLFELAYEGGPGRTIGGFDPSHGGHRAVIGAVADLLRELLGGALQPAEVPGMHVRGRRVRCPLMTVDLAGLADALPAPERGAICDEVRGARADGAGAGPGATLAAASLAQHGARLQALMLAGVCGKQDAGWGEVLACQRRKLWAALFHPGTVHEAFAGLPIGFQPHRPFMTTGDHQAHPFVARLWAAVRGHPGVTVVGAGALTGLASDTGGRVRLQFGDTEMRVPAERCAIGTSPDEAFRAAGVEWRPERMAASIVWIGVRDGDVLHAPSSLLVGDPDHAAFRVSHAGSGAGTTTFAVEFGARPGCGMQAAATLCGLGLVRAGARAQVVHTVAGRGQVLPTAAAQAGFMAAVDRLSEVPVQLLAGVRRFGFDSLNDQIADGLHFGECRC